MIRDNAGDWSQPSGGKCRDNPICGAEKSDKYNEQKKVPGKICDIKVYPHVNARNE